MEIKDNQKFKVIKAYETMLLIETNNKLIELSREDKRLIKDNQKGHFELYHKDKILLFFDNINKPLEVQ